METLPILNQLSPLHQAAMGGVYVIVVGVAADGQIAFVRSAEGNRSWELPGGMVEDGESTLEAATREFKEETGWQLEGAIEVATINNVLPGENNLHSRAFLIVGRVVIKEGDTPDDTDILESALKKDVPEESTFAREWIDELIQLSVHRLSATESQHLWNATAAIYSDETEISETEVHYGPLIPGESQLRLLPPLAGARVLDLGCGAGHNLAALRFAGASDGLGIDCSNEQVKQARQRLGHSLFEVVEADISMFNFANTKPFDLVLSIFSMAFIANPAALIKAVAHQLRPGGYLVLATDHPSRLGMWNVDHMVISDWYAPRTRRRLWTFAGQEPISYTHHLHDLPTLVKAIFEAGLLLQEVLEPKSLPFDRLAEAPYRSAYYLGRHKELSRMPYTLILKARRPGP